MSGNFSDRISDRVEVKEIQGFYEFAGFRLDPKKKRLLQDEKIVSLTPKEFEVLLLLVENAGQTVERDTLLETIWADVYIEEGTLTRNISWLRKKLAPYLPEDFKVIETVPKIGYCFLPEVSFVEIPKKPEAAEIAPNGKPKNFAPPAAETVTPKNENPETTSRNFSAKFILIPVILLAIVAAGSFIVYQNYFTTKPQMILATKIVPLTGSPGRETSPAFSPDGKQIVYSWDGNTEGNKDIYIKLIGEGEPVRLTTTPADEINPVFSPDGKSIAFVRILPEGNEIISIPALGGAERKVYDGASYASLSFSPDGKFLAHANLDLSKSEAGIFTINLQTGEKMRLTAPPAPAVDHTPRFSPDGKWLAFIRHFGTFRREVFIVPATGGEAKQITTDESRVYGLAWDSDSRNLFFTSFRKINQLGLWEVSTDGEGEPQLIPTGSKNLESIAISPDGRKVAFVEETSDENIWEIEPNGKKQVLIRSVSADHSPQISPDGKHIAFASDRSGEYEIWIADADGKNQRRLTFSDGSAGSPRFSPDGKFIAYDVQKSGTTNIFIISTDGGTPQRLTDDDKNNFLPAWSLDGKTLFFVSNRSGSGQIWRMSVSGQSEASQLTKQGGFEMFAAPDGKHIIYSRGDGKPGLWQISVDGADEKLIPELAEAATWRSWTLAANGIYFTAPNTQPPYQIKFFDFNSHQTRIIGSVEKSPLNYYPNLSVSANGEKILYARQDQSSGTIFLAELESPD